MGTIITGSIKSLAQGFLVATGIVWIFNITSLIRGGDAWLGLAYLLILLIPILSIFVLKLHGTKTQTFEHKLQLRKLLFGFQGVALGFWMFDIITTIYAIDVTGLAIELNPLGWPLGILGAFAFYGPTLLFSHVLLFRIKETVSLYAAIPLTLLTLGMGSMNLIAGAQNFQVFVDTAMLPSNMCLSLLSIIAALNIILPLTIRRMVAQPTFHFKKTIH